MPEDTRAKKRATDDLNAIEALRKVPAFNYLIRRCWEEVDKHRDKLLTDRSLSPEALHLERARYLKAKEMAELTTGDEAACRSILESLSEED